MDKICKVCVDKEVKTLHFEAHWMYRGKIAAAKERFKAIGVTLKIKIGVETFDYKYREEILRKGLNTDKIEEIQKNFDEVCLLNQLMTSNNKERLMEQLRELVKHTEVPVLIEAANNLCEKLDMFDDAKVRQIYEDRCNRKILTQPIYII